ncbi:sensor domain-containing diguanylate cyclase [Bacillus luteolus]|uniref:Sensor domain-containing diguanylate cyclase n=1 Tax=Litchfieldia luteola TaxID=682179 RepID=A0ABR9QH45_9BACI|nr:diguanylate cyclase [Cytobacillus luteolus]MBE4907827.1 sensor domain-containing diguanylate cyclase [Cytobacillus luteolus]MBP1944016.1 diguanylate cyclase (GGDEF)-like protein [Cytobacillus luteolus]
MNTLDIQLFLYIFVLTIFINFLRFKVSTFINKWILLFSSLLIVLLDTLLYGSLHTGWLLLMFIGISVLCFKRIGGLVSVGISWLITIVQSGHSNLLMLMSYLLFAICFYFVLIVIENFKKERNDYLQKLIVNSKQLNVFREVSFSMQQTRQLQKLLQMILTSVTAGYGLGFNRAMILLMNDEGNMLKGIMGTGPMSAAEGYATWENLTKHKYKLNDLIEIKEKEQETDQLLNERVKRLEIALDEPNFLNRTLETGLPLHIKKIDESDEILVNFIRVFSMSELAVFPLITQGKKVGVLIIDNPVNKRPITPDGIDSVIPLANQAAVAIEQSHLYRKVEEMALRDGLTGLYNQRAFQLQLVENYPTEEKDENNVLSLIILDIDFFKHFNDKNGHLLGNEVLMQLAEVINETIRPRDLAFRFGGEEFVVLLPATYQDEARLIAEQLRKNVESTAFPNGEKQPNGRLTISLGVSSTMSVKSSNPHYLVDEADKALYRAKETGKNKVVMGEGAKSED